MPVSTDIFPPFPANLVECRVAMTSQGVACLNVLYIIGDPAQSFAQDVADAATSLETFYEALAVASLGTFWRVDQMTWIDRSVANGQELITVPTTPIVGDETAEPLPLQTQLAITWRTANTGRRYRGRTFIPGWTIDSNSSTGQPEPATIVAVQAIVDALISSLDSSDQSLAVLSRGKVTTLPDVAPPSAPDWEGFATPVINGLVRGGWDVLRSRRT